LKSGDVSTHSEPPDWKKKKTFENNTNINDTN
jgi:hypothetical protein